MFKLFLIHCIIAKTPLNYKEFSESKNDIAWVIRYSMYK